MAASSLVDLLHHPVRWRVMQALIGRQLTTADLAERLPDVALTTLYRQVRVLVEAGVVVVIGERRIRGTVERTYELNTEASSDDGSGPRVDAEQLRTMFAVFIAGVGSGLERYVDRADIDPARDGVAFRQHALCLSDEEFAEFTERMRELLESYDRQPGPGRTRRVMSTILLPDP